MSTLVPARRGFLRGLVSLPLIGGGVTLIGSPTGVAAAPSQELLAAYNEWLFLERRILCMEAWPGTDAEDFVPSGTAAGKFHLPQVDGQSWRDLPMPSSRAALVLSAVGAEWRR